MAEPAADKPPQGEEQSKGDWFKRPISWIAALLAAIFLAAGTAFGSGLGQKLFTSVTQNPSPGGSSKTLAPDTVTHTSQPSRAGFLAMSGPLCKAGNAQAMFTNGTWTPLAGSAAASCGNALVHLTTDSSKAANWVFTPGAGATCAFQIHIPRSNMINADSVTYQAWETLPGQHADADRIGGNVTANQEAHRGGSITITFGPTETSIIDLQLYDDNNNHTYPTYEVAGMVTATCH